MTLTPPLFPLGSASDRPRTDEISIVRNLGDIGSAVAVQSIDVNEAGAGNPTIYTPPANAIFLVYAWILQNTGVVTTVEFRSGATAIGRIFLPLNVSDRMTTAGVPYLVGRVAGEAFKINIAAGITGLFTVGYRPI